ncbi:MAG: family 16 glycosylhydrolase [Verrucomicrobiota bacterium]
MLLDLKRYTLLALLGASSAFAELPTNGLVLKLDSSIKESVVLNKDGLVIEWKDQSGHGNNATAKATHAPYYMANSMAGKSVIRFDGEQWLDLPVLSDEVRGYSIFIVYQRKDGHPSRGNWQRLISGATTERPDDTKEPNIQLSTEEKGGVIGPQIAYDLFRSDLKVPMTIGARDIGHFQRFHGDIAEVLVYNHSFIVYEPIQAVEQYLQKKWNIEIKTKGDWTRMGPLPEPLPVRETDNLPLSDQANEGKWERYEPMWDEFNGDRLDLNKWFDHNPFWYGRAPGRFLARYVDVKDGMMQITMAKDTSLPHERFYGKNHGVYKDYASGTVVSKDRVNYGYFEIRAKPMDSAASSAWWFTGSSTDKKTGAKKRLEIDVFEIGGKAKNKEYSYNMNLHDFKTRSTPHHYSLGGIWKTEKPLASEFRVYGLEWTPETIKYYVDGVLIRRVDNEVWHGPQFMLFDSETMFDWLGVPEDSDLPSTFLVDYVRAWKNPETANDWREHYRALGNYNTSRITDYVRSMDPN